MTKIIIGIAFMVAVLFAVAQNAMINRSYHSIEEDTLADFNSRAMVVQDNDTADFAFR